MYISDQSADATIVTNDKIRAAVEGKAAMLWLPGQSAGVTVNMCLMFGWMGTVISVYSMVPEIRHAMGWYALGVGLVSAAMGIHWFMIIRGFPAARMRMYWHTVATLSIGALVTAVALVRQDMVAAGLGGAGTVFAFAAMRLVAGPSYALFAAFYRAKRAHELVDNSR
jgi:hypothetical protein